MIPSEVQVRMKSHVWKAIAQNEIDVSGLDKNSLEKLVDFVVEAAMLEMDNQLVDTLAEEKVLIRAHSLKQTATCRKRIAMRK